MTNEKQKLTNDQQEFLQWVQDNAKYVAELHKICQDKLGADPDFTDFAVGVYIQKTFALEFSVN